MEGKLDEMSVLRGPVHRFGTSRQHRAQHRVVVSDARLVERDPHGGPWLVGHLRRHHERVGRWRSGACRRGDVLHDDVGTSLDLRQVHGQLQQVFVDPGVHHDATAAG